MDVPGKVIIVTGAASGIGRGLCERFAREGAEVVIAADIDEPGAQAVAREVGGAAFACDVRRESDIVNLVRFTEERYGRVDLFCSNAGIFVPGGYEADNESWNKIWEINVLAHVYAARAVLPGMMAQGGGGFLITASAAGLLSQIGSLPYSVTKHAAVGLAENLAITYGDRGIEVFVLCPQAVETEMTRQGGGVAALDGLLTPAEVAAAVMEALRNGDFLILPHPEVRTYVQRKAADYNRWLSGMRRLQERLLSGGPLKTGVNQ